MIKNIVYYIANLTRRRRTSLSGGLRKNIMKYASCNMQRISIKFEDELKLHRFVRKVYEKLEDTIKNHQLKDTIHPTCHDWKKQEMEGLIDVYCDSGHSMKETMRYLTSQHGISIHFNEMYLNSQLTCLLLRTLKVISAKLEAIGETFLVPINNQTANMMFYAVNRDPVINRKFLNIAIGRYQIKDQEQLLEFRDFIDKIAAKQHGRVKSKVCFFH